MFKDFKAFIMRGNVVDMAVGIIIGAAFGPIVSALVNGIIMPPIGLLLGKVDFANLFVVLKDGKTIGPPYASLDAAQKAGAVVISYGTFINSIITFLIIAAVVFFFIVRPIAKMNARQKAKEVAAATPAAATTKTCPYCQSTISIKATRCPNCTSELKA
jgi:large conductance mechanosensitive channel